MRRRDRLRALEMRIGGHDRIDLRLCLVDQHLEQRRELGVEFGERIEGPEPRPSRHLIVPAAPRVQAPRGFARLLMEQAIDEGVHILIRLDRLLAFAMRWPTRSNPERIADTSSGGAPRRAKGGGPRLGELDIEGPEPEVDGDRPIDRLGSGAGPRRSGRPRVCEKNRQTWRCSEVKERMNMRNIQKSREGKGDQERRPQIDGEG